MFAVNVETEGLIEVDKFFKKHFPLSVERATTRALNKTVTSIKSKAVKEVSRKSGVKPQKLISQRMSSFKANRKKKSIGVIFKFNVIPAHAWGEISWNKEMSGAKAGRKLFKGAFAATPTKGKNAGVKRIYDRVSRTNNPQKDLRVRSIKLQPYKYDLPLVGKKVVKNSLNANFLKQLKYELSKEGFKL